MIKSNYLKIVVAIIPLRWYNKITEGGENKMIFSVYLDGEGYFGEVSAPDRETAVAFLASRGIEPGTYKLCEVYDA